jgi:hypothetical protein
VTPHVYRPTCRILCGGARTFRHPLRAIRRRRSDRPGFAATSSMCRQRFVAACSWPCALYSRRPFRCPRRLRADDGPFVCAYPERGVGGAPGGAHWSSCRACEARQPRERHAPHPVATGTAPSALHRGDFRPRDHASWFRQCRRTMPRLPNGSAARPKPFGSRNLPAAVTPQSRDATTPLRLQASPETPLMSEDANLIA